MLDPTNPQPTDSRQTTTARRVVIVGGVAGGASCAARLRRLDETVEILMIDRGPYVSFANCGLPYYVGNVISDERRLLVASREMFHERFNIDVRTDTEVTAIDRNAGTIAICDVHTGKVGTERYDALVLSRTVHNLAEAELCYAPQFGRGKRSGESRRHAGGERSERRYAFGRLGSAGADRCFAAGRPRT